MKKNVSMAPFAKELNTWQPDDRKRIEIKWFIGRITTKKMENISCKKSTKKIKYGQTSTD